MKKFPSSSWSIDAMSIQHVTTKRECENKNNVNFQPSLYFFSGTNNKYALLKLLNPRIHQWHNGQRGRERKTALNFFLYTFVHLWQIHSISAWTPLMRSMSSTAKIMLFKSLNSRPEQQRRQSKKKSSIYTENQSDGDFHVLLFQKAIHFIWRFKLHVIVFYANVNRKQFSSWKLTPS